MRKSLTMLELMLVIIIIGICSSFSLMNFSGQMEQFKSKEAENNLLAINNAQKRYKFTQGRYFVCAPKCTISNINENLSLAIHGAYHFNYSIEPYGPGNEGYRAIAKRNKGQCSNKNMAITYINNTLTKGCALW